MKHPQWRKSRPCSTKPKQECWYDLKESTKDDQNRESARKIDKKCEATNDRIGSPQIEEDLGPGGNAGIFNEVFAHEIAENRQNLMNNSSTPPTQYTI